jgi:O-antigen ligase
VLIVAVGAVTVAVAHEVIRYGGGGPFDWNLTLLIIGLAGAAFSLAGARRSEAPAPLDRIVLWTAALFPAYVAFQLVPLPLGLLKIVSPTRAEVALALAGVMPAPSFAPLSIAPPETWAHGSRIVGYALIFLLVLQAARCSIQIKWVPVVPLIVIGGVEAVWGLVQYSAGAKSVSGTYLNKNHFAGLLAMVLPFAIALALAMLGRGHWSRSTLPGVAAINGCGLFLLAAGMFVAISLSLSKMGVLSMLGSLFIVGAVGVGSRLSGWKRRAVVIALAAVGPIVLVFFTPNELIQRFGVLTSEQPTEGRLPIWKDSLHLFAAYPLFGSGLNSFLPGLLRYQTLAVNLAWPNAHNDYLQLLAELGIVGFLIPAVLVSTIGIRATQAAVWNENRETRLLALGCLGGLAAILIHSVADFNLRVPANAMVLAWICGLSAALPAGTELKRTERSMGSVLFSRKVLVGLGCLATFHASAALLYLNFFRGDPRAERVFCRFGICDGDEALAALQRQHNGTAIAAVPPADLMEYLRRDAAGPNRWCDVGASMQNAGRTAEARYCFARAVALGARIPSTLYSAADFHFDVGENEKGLHLMARALEGDATYDWPVFDDYDKREIGLDEILRSGLPDDPRVSRSFLRWHINGEDVGDHSKIWSWIVQHGHVDDPLVREYIAFLMKHDTPKAAWEAWALYAADRGEGYPEPNRIFNSSFEREPSGVVFDWAMWNLNDDVKVAPDGTVARTGGTSLRLRFAGNTNVNYQDTSQRTFVMPGFYRFQAFVRTRGITTDQGIGFHICDTDGSGKVDVRTEQVIGTNDWKRIEQIVQVPYDVRLLVVRLIRQPSLKFDSDIAGTAWVDDVSLTRIE